MAYDASITSALQRPYGADLRLVRATLECALERLLGAVESVVADLDALDGDPDLEATCEDEGAACEDEGVDTDTEPDGAGAYVMPWSGSTLHSAA